MLLRWAPLLSLLALTAAHQPQQFPGQQAQQQQAPPPPQAGQHAQPAAAHPNSHAHEFGGEQAMDKDHIKEHLDGKVDPTANMTPEQLQFHYFNMHDLDKNGRLDGVELIKAITHFHNENPGPQHQANAGVPPPLPSEIELEQMIDSILKEDDFNGDGFIDYAEFLRAQKMREDQARAHQEQMAKQGGQ